MKTNQVTIAIIDYDTGNLHSACKGLEAAGATAIISQNPEQILAADGIVLPGVGAFDPAMQKIRQRNLETTIKQAIAAQKPFLGICVGMQVLFESSAEGKEPGLGIIGGRVERLNSEPGITIPHIGWNQLHLNQAQSPLWQQLGSQPWLYFVHSYIGVPTDSDIIAATTSHGSQTITAAIATKNLMAVQFHPEKSSHSGIQVLRNFVSLVQSQPSHQ
jgi:imidazole glycerol-phosphate synthase subunit HisH